MRYLAGRAVPTSVAWVTNQSTRWGSCTPRTAPSGSPRGCAGCPAGCSTTCCSTSSPTCCSPATATRSGRCSTPTPAPSGPAATSRASPRPPGSSLDDGSPLEEDVVPEPLEQSAKARRRSTQSRTRPPADG
nr:hypothetical protein [Angustibacter aerolatus]